MPNSPPNNRKSAREPHPPPADFDHWLRSVFSYIFKYWLVYVTARDVTPARYEEIISRRHITDSLNNLKVDAQRHFGEFLHVDIYDFTSFAIKYHPDPDLILQNVFVFGKEKQDLYLGPNSRIENPVRWINPNTLQGILYINREDILHRTSGSRRVYRYWRCRAPYNRSETTNISVIFQKTSAYVKTTFIT